MGLPKCAFFLAFDSGSFDFYGTHYLLFPNSDLHFSRFQPTKFHLLLESRVNKLSSLTVLSITDHSFI